MRATLAGIDFPGRAPLVGGREHGWSLRPEPLVGWRSMASKGRAEDRPDGHGSFAPSRVDLASLAITLPVIFKGDSAVEVRAAYGELLAAIASGPSHPLTVDDDVFVGSRQVEVQRVSPLPYTEAISAIVTIEAVAHDPLLYGPDVLVSTGPPTPGSGMTWPLTWPLDWGTPGDPGRLVVDNTEGTAETIPTRLRVAGGALELGFQVVEVETGRRLRYEWPVAAADFVDLLPRAGRVRINGTSDVPDFLTIAQWPFVPAGESRTYAFEPLGATSGSPTLQALYASAHI
jgi:hypothetical protein